VESRRSCSLAVQWSLLGQCLTFAEVDRLLLGAVNDGIVPGISVCVRSAGQEVHAASFGHAELTPNARLAGADTVWDLASITKALGTTPIAMAMVGEGILDLHAPVRERLPRTPPGITAAHCLAHVSGLPKWDPMWETFGLDGVGSKALRDDVLARARTMPTIARPGESYVYSDMGFLTLCALLEDVGGQRLDTLYEHYVRAPSGVDLRWGWPDAAATENCPHRGHVVCGEVHDLNAWMMGGVSSHAGLFGTCRSIATAAEWQLRAWQGESQTGLVPEVVRQFWSHSAVGSHHLGWDGVSATGSSAGNRWPVDGVGHLGFTGCSVWIAPRQGVVVSIASNRVHPLIEGGAVPDAPIHPRYTAFRGLRPAVHTAIIEALECGSGWLT
jgi:CubicO group peptidase (beta-lactamase class C family)